MNTGEFGLASGENTGGGYERVWHLEAVPTEEVAFESGVFLLTKVKAAELRDAQAGPDPGPTDNTGGDDETEHEEPPAPQPSASEPVLVPTSQKAKLSITGNIPKEAWNRVGTRLMPKLQAGEDINAKVELSAIVGADQAQNVANELRQAWQELGLDLQLDISEA